MRYRLVITTTGVPGRLDRMLETFDARVRPRPVEAVIVDDSGDDHYIRYLKQLVNERKGWRLVWHPLAEGTAHMIATAWEEAGGFARPRGPGRPDWVFWTSDDTEFGRSIELSDLGHVLDHEARVVQMSLAPIRGAGDRRGSGSVIWFEHRHGWTTAPSLFRSSLARAYPWKLRSGPDFAERPETTFGSWGPNSNDFWLRPVQA